VLAEVSGGEGDVWCRRGRGFQRQSVIQIVVEHERDVVDCDVRVTEFQTTDEVVVGVGVVRDEEWTEELGGGHIHLDGHVHFDCHVHLC